MIIDIISEAIKAEQVCKCGMQEAEKLAVGGKPSSSSRTTASPKTKQQQDSSPKQKKTNGKLTISLIITCSNIYF